MVFLAPSLKCKALKTGHLQLLINRQTKREPQQQKVETRSCIHLGSSNASRQELKSLKGRGPFLMTIPDISLFSFSGWTTLTIQERVLHSCNFFYFPYKRLQRLDFSWQKMVLLGQLGFVPVIVANVWGLIGHPDTPYKV